MNSSNNSYLRLPYTQPSGRAPENAPGDSMKNCLTKNFSIYYIGVNGHGDTNQNRSSLGSNKN